MGAVHFRITVTLTQTLTLTLRILMWCENGLVPHSRKTLRILGAIEIHCNRAVYVSLNTNANPNPNPNPK